MHPITALTTLASIAGILTLAPGVSAFHADLTFYPFNCESTNSSTFEYFTYTYDDDGSCQNTGTAGKGCQHFLDGGNTRGTCTDNAGGFLANSIDVTPDSDNVNCDTFSDANCVTVVGSQDCGGFRGSLPGTSFKSFKCYAAS